MRGGAKPSPPLTFRLQVPVERAVLGEAAAAAAAAERLLACVAAYVPLDGALLAERLLADVARVRQAVAVRAYVHLAAVLKRTDGQMDGPADRQTGGRMNDLLDG